MNPARIAELTIVEFKNLVREAVMESFADLLGDPDEGARSAGRICRGAEAILWRQSARAENVESVRGCGQIQIGPMSLHWTSTLAMSRCVV